MVLSRPVLGHTGGVQTPEVTAESAEQPAGPLRSAVVVNPARVPRLPELREIVEQTLSAAGWPAPGAMQAADGLRAMISATHFMAKRKPPIVLWWNA